MEDKYIIKITVMSINSTIGAEGISPKLLVFEAMPKLEIPVSQAAQIPTGQRMVILENARVHYIKHAAIMRQKKTETSFIPKPLPITLKYGDKVLAYKDTTGR